MAIRMEGASSRNDDVLAGHAAPDLLGNQQGYTRPGSGLDSWDNDVNRARGLGQQSHDRLAPQIDQTDAGESRGLQMGALGMLRAQGEGTAPSASAILAQRANQGAVTAAAQHVAGARTAGGAIAAQRAAGGAAGQTMLAGNAQNANARLGEVTQGLGAYAQGAGHVQNQDVAAAQADADLEAQQRQLNEARQQGFERRGWNTRSQEQQTHDRWQALREGDLNRMENERLARNAARDAQNSEYVNTGAAVAMGGMNAYANSQASDDGKKTTTSDERAKVHVGSLASLRMRGGR